LSTFNNFNQSLINEYRENGGKVSGIFAGVPLLLLTTTGAKSGKPRVSPLIYTTDGDRLAIIASKGGEPTNPDWYHNLIANPVATVEVGTEKFQVRANVANPTDRDRLYAKMVETWPDFAEYEKKTTRKIPVFVLERVS
jgi:deazaflavin-dependent oxidoreductase (nitroreductase family)